MIAVRYDEFAVDEADLNAITTELSELAPTRVRWQQIDRGGIETALWITLSYVGLKYLDAVFGELASRHVGWIADKLKKLFPPKEAPEAVEYAMPVTVILSADDIDIEINLPPTADVATLTKLITGIVADLDALQRSKLVEQRIQHVHIPMALDGDEWIEVFFATAEEFDSRFWGLEVGGFGILNQIYDTQERALIEMPSRDWDDNE